MDGGDRTGAGAWGFSHREGIASGVRQAEAVGGSGEPSAEEAREKDAGVEGRPCRVENDEKTQELPRGVFINKSEYWIRYAD
jgi:hypothetical protein